MTTAQVLIIEDDPDIGTSLVEVLQYIDIEAELIADGAKALDKIRQLRPRLLLLDIHLPGKSGIEILKEIRADPSIAALKVIMVTADGFLTEAGIDQADHILLKPYTITQLSDAVMKMLEG